MLGGILKCCVPVLIRSVAPRIGRDLSHHMKGSKTYLAGNVRKGIVTRF